MPGDGFNLLIKLAANLALHPLVQIWSLLAELTWYGKNSNIMTPKWVQKLMCGITVFYIQSVIVAVVALPLAAVSRRPSCPNMVISGPNNQHVKDQKSRLQNGCLQTNGWCHSYSVHLSYTDYDVTMSPGVYAEAFSCIRSDFWFLLISSCSQKFNPNLLLPCLRLLEGVHWRQAAPGSSL